MANTVRVEIITPEEIFYSGDAEMVVVRELDGEEGYMHAHTWACKLLDDGDIKIREAGSENFKVAHAKKGFIDVKESIVIYTDEASWA